MDNRPIGVFDSGLGGLTAVRALRELLPEENIIYFADSGRVPYGKRPVEQLRRMAVQDLDFVSSRGAKAIIAACGTISSTAPDILRGWPVPAFGVLESPVRHISRMEDTGPIGVIATAASIQSGSFARALRAACPGRAVFPVACPDFVPLIESGHCRADDERVQEAVEEYLRPLKEEGVSVLLLGCTHYGLIAGAIRDYLGEGTELVEASRCAAEDIGIYLRSNGLLGSGGESRYFTSGSGAEFSAMASAFLGGGEIRAEETPVMEV